MTDVKERPILFSAPMVRAILEGRKTVTRRPVKGAGLKWLEDFTPKYVADLANSLCPYGKPGERLWVRETWGRTYNVNGQEDWPGRPHLAREGDEVVTIYRADGPWSWCDGDGFGSDRSYWKPSIHMFRRDSRILLEITDVRVERLQDITPAQVTAEGMSTRGEELWGSEWWVDAPDQAIEDARKGFSDLWVSTGGDWDANPWVWVVEFKLLN
jgi:hypothetical protein